MKIEIKGISDIGQSRPNNEDMLLVGHNYVRNGAIDIEVSMKASTRCAAMVADGIGGHEGGEYASELALHRFEHFLDTLPDGLDNEELRRRLDQWIDESHAVINDGGTEEHLRSMGTTLSGCMVYERKLYWLNVGDSRVYLCRDGILRQITTDHTLRNLLHDPSIPGNVIYNCLGGGGVEVFCDFDEMPYYVGDRFLVCSDGLSDSLDEATLQSLLLNDAPPAEFIDQAYQTSAATDNISLIIIKLTE